MDRNDWKIGGTNFWILIGAAIAAVILISGITIICCWDWRHKKRHEKGQSQRPQIFHEDHLGGFANPGLVTKDEHNGPVFTTKRSLDTGLLSHSADSGAKPLRQEERPEHASRVFRRMFQKGLHYTDRAPFLHDPPGHICGLPCCHVNQAIAVKPPSASGCLQSPLPPFFTTSASSVKTNENSFFFSQAAPQTPMFQWDTCHNRWPPSLAFASNTLSLVHMAREMNFRRDLRAPSDSSSLSPRSSLFEERSRIAQAKADGHRYSREEFVETYGGLPSWLAGLNQVQEDYSHHCVEPDSDSEFLRRLRLVRAAGVYGATPGPAEEEEDEEEAEKEGKKRTLQQSSIAKRPFAVIHTGRDVRENPVTWIF